MSLDDIVGTRIGRRTILAIVSRSQTRPRQRPVMVHVRCDCGNCETVGLPSVRKSPQCHKCGMLVQAKKVATHGESSTKLYRLWRSMHNRCNGTHDNESAQWYADKGISVCDEWQTYERFRDWAVSHGWKPGLTIDRLNSDDDYHPANCEWVTRSENTRRMMAQRFRYARHTPIEMLWGTC